MSTCGTASRPVSPARSALMVEIRPAFVLVTGMVVFSLPQIPFVQHRSEHPRSVFRQPLAGSRAWPPSMGQNVPKCPQNGLGKRSFEAFLRIPYTSFSPLLLRSPRNAPKRGKGRLVVVRSALIGASRVEAEI